MEKQVKKGAICKCSKGKIGLVTSRSPVATVYSDGSVGIACRGIYLEDESREEGQGKAGNLGWSSRNPIVLCYLDDFK